MAESKFAGIVKARKSESPDGQTSGLSEVRNAETLKAKMGRPPGKKSDAGYRQVTVYLPVELHEQGREIAFRSRGETDFSDIVAEALSLYFRKSETPEV
jgi:hypothetical protein